MIPPLINPNKTYNTFTQKTSPENTNQKSDTIKTVSLFFIANEDLKRNEAAKFSSPLQPPNTKNHIKKSVFNPSNRCHPWPNRNNDPAIP
nr:hypothetical protein [uncultured Flavobacterium sp.]